MKGATALYSKIGKRALDLLACILALPIAVPLLVVIAVIVRLHFGSPVLFIQERLGSQGRPFLIRKFRTMSNALGTDGKLLPDEERLTSLGRFLRSTSLDELPEMINVFLGQMSLVGPRPLYSHYRDRYTKEQFRRHDVLPGITGWAQIKGRNVISWDQKFAFDLWYVDHQSLGLDLKILALTAVKMFSRDGINQPGHATAQEFEGTLRKEA
jgi:lipopolysaccharide/colanic/teichoic acid biosynthesis glycosyltransferase